jgi:predicted nuclease of predicted toxin-antitoxin system
VIRILLDQNIPAQAVQWLQEEIGSEAEILSTRMLGTPRMTDAELFRYCQSHGMVIVTYDEDFQNPLLFPEYPGFGVVRLNVFPTGWEQTRMALQRLLAHYPVAAWEKASIVVDAHRIRYQKK